MNAAEQLLGLDLPGEWRVTRHLARNVNGTGGTFSHSYEVRKGEAVGFLKAFDFQEAFAVKDPLTMVGLMTAAYNHERDILDHCGNRRLSNVVTALAHGNVTVPGMSQMEGRVFYIIFEMADGDVRCQMTTDQNFGTQKCMEALKDVSLGLWQVHKEAIAHQDAKPSNVLSCGDSFKLADFGRASWKGFPTSHDSYLVAGDKTYAPPEQLFGFIHNDFVPRRIGCDLYMLGNLASFLFSGVNVTAALISHLDPQHHPRKWQGTYQQVLPYLQTAFTRVIEDLEPVLDESVREFALSYIKQLCEPDLMRRGHPKGIGRDDQYSLERYVSHLDRAVRLLRARSRTVLMHP